MKFSVGDVVSAPGLQFRVTYVNTSDGSYDLKILTHGVLATSEEQELEYVPESALERGNRVEIGDKFRNRRGQGILVVVSAEPTGKVKVFDTGDENVYSTDDEDLLDSGAYEKLP